MAGKSAFRSPPGADNDRSTTHPQGLSTSSPSMPTKSLSLRVASASPWARATAAIWTSSVEMGMPRRVRAATSKASSAGGVVERQATVNEFLGEHSLGGGCEAIAASAGGQQRNPQQDFGASHGADEVLHIPLLLEPREHGHRRFLLHEFREDIRVERDSAHVQPSSSITGTRAARRGVIGRSSAASPTKRSWILLANTPPAGFAITARRRISRASCSIEQPCRAACWRSRVLSSSSRFRMVRLAMRGSQLHALLSVYSPEPILGNATGTARCKLAPTTLTR